MSPAQADMDLLQRYVNAGDPEAFDQIVKRYASMVYNTCWRVLRDTGRAEEVCQDTFFKLMTKPASVKSSLGGWLHRTATTGSLDVLRSETARRRRERVYAREAYINPASQGTWQALSPLIDEALNELPPSTRTLLVEHFLMGKTQRQLANQMNTSTATISRRISRGLSELRKHLEGKGLVLAIATLMALSCNAANAAHPVPAALSRELGKMSMVSGQTVGVGLGGSFSTAVVLAASGAGVLVMVAALWLAMTIMSNHRPSDMGDSPGEVYYPTASP